ncbi:hypothetical protein QYE76_000738 [Lolium multiflorum]|uniref:CCHC-type domain-containing protein n=1 Tax=Lolium multiflorum TaxID=4521 RepID=A0AAD8RJR9_LOLMU|nr:hypothetical protein QYE76_000738 [Lolium multiflorum]
MLAKNRKSLRQQRAKKDATIAHLRAKIVSLEATVKAQEDQMREMEEEDREDERAECQANIAALQQIANNNQGHGNHDHPGSKLKNFQNTNPPVFSKTEEPLDADDWLQTMENNLEVAGVDANEKVLFTTHYLAGPTRAWWTSTRAMNAGQIMTLADFKLKFSKYHMPPGLIKKMRDDFRELKQDRMTVVEYRDRFLTLSRYAPDKTDTTEKRKERFLNGLHDEMQTVLVNIPFADLEALVDSAIQMEGKLHQANENRKRRMMTQSGPSNTPRYRPSSSGGFNPRNNKPNAPMSRSGFQNRSGGNPRLGGHNNSNNNHHAINNNFNRALMRAPGNNNPNNTNTAPSTGSDAIPITPKDKVTITCYECGVVGHYSNECPKRNPSKEIFSSGRNQRPGPIFTRSFQKTEGKTKWGHGGRHTGRRGPRGHAALACGAPVTPTCPRLHIVFVVKPPAESHYTENLLETPRRQSHLGGFGDRLRHLPEGIISGGLFTAMVASGVMSE